jgi:hypothetical protein
MFFDILKAIFMIGLLASCVTRSDEMIITRDDCGAEESISLNVKRFATFPEAYAGKCVMAKGYIANRGFYLTRQAFEKRPSLKNNIAIYGDTDDVDLWAIEQAGELVGFATTCDQLYKNAQAEADRASNEEMQSIVFMSGRCHYDGANAVLVVSKWSPAEDLLK